MIDKKTQGKKSRQAGARFELRVRADLEKKKWIVAKWPNNVEFHNDEDVHDLLFTTGKLVKAKPKFVFNPGLKRRIPIGIGAGFPDFIIFKPVEWHNPNVSPMKKYYQYYEIEGVESKMNGYLDKEERAKCKWLIENKIFSKIKIARKGKKRGSIEYRDYENKSL